MVRIAAVFLAAFIFVVPGTAMAAKKTIAVGEIKYRAKDSSENKRYQAFGKGAREDTRAFADMLTTALAKTRKFRVMERDRLGEILKEQKMSLVGLATRGYRGRKLNLQGVDFVVTGAITEYGQKASGFKMKGFATSEKTAKMAVDIRVLNVANGEIEIAETVSVTVSVGGGFRLKGFASMGQDDSASALGEVSRRVANDVTSLIVSSIYPVRVLKRTAQGTVFLNYGKGSLGNGDILDVFVKGEALIDPDTGENLGSEDEFIGRISVFDARTRFSKAKILKEVRPIGKGMIARRAKKAVAPNKPMTPSLFDGSGGEAQHQ